MITCFFLLSSKMAQEVDDGDGCLESEVQVHGA